MDQSVSWLVWWDDADLVVRGVFALLASFSVVTWWIILYKLVDLVRAGRAESAAARHLLEGRPLAELTRTGADRSAAAALSREALARDRGSRLDARLGEVVRHHRLGLESGLTLLATIGNASPFIGLLGTVWGIMHALQSLDSDAAVSLEVVAGPVAEALVATAAGLFAAIPAVVGYNLLLRLLRRVSGTTEGNAVRILALTEGS